ncbi:MAG: hypothetical protein KGI49_01530 [Patescibacteria group bacterium]|nr:hypothetical protein [Patescibacteria group bacterium]
MKAKGFSVINDKNTRGVVGPASFISQKLLEDIVDLINYSGSAVSARLNHGFKRSKQLIDGRELRESLGV